jgi:serine/threonine-protein kinase
MTEFQTRLQIAMGDAYRLERELGGGGMAVIYLATDVKHRRSVAVKVLRPEIAAAIGPDRFVREIEIAARLNHPHIVPLFDSGAAGGFVFYVMPLVDGESLRDRLDREHQLPLREARQIATEVADALTYAHGQGVIHRDIKPENILLSGGHAQVADFGIARAVLAAGHDRLTATGIAVGTPQYMSPEQASGLAVDARTDVYSLGCVLYEMLGGQAPFVGTTAQAVISQKLTAPTPSLRHTRESVPEAVDRVVRRALARLPAERFASASELAEALGATDGAFDRAEPAARGRRSRWAALASIGLMILAAAGWWTLRGRAGSATPIRSLAVLPLVNLSRDSAEEYFVGGMHDALVASLAQIEAIRVISRTSVMAFRDAPASVPDVAERLHVDAVVEGSVLRVGDRVRITVKLVGASPERELWGESYERDVSDALSVHRDVAEAIARRIELRLSRDRGRPAERGHRPGPAAQDAYLRGRHAWHRQTRLDVEQAVRHFEQALALDPQYALAYAGLADCYVVLSWVGPSPLPPRQAYPRAAAAAERALALDSTVADAHVALGLVRWRFDWDAPAAEREFVTALALSPNDATAHHWYGLFLASQGRHDEAQVQLQAALTLDPLSRLITANAAWVRYFARDFDQAMAQAQAAVQLWPDYPAGHYMLGLAYEEHGKLAEAIAAFQHGLEAAGEELPYLESALGHALGRAGRRAEARQVLARARRRGYFPPSLAAAVHIGLGEREAALEWLGRADEARDASLAFLAVNPVWDPLRRDPTFRDLMHRVGLLPGRVP